MSAPRERELKYVLEDASAFDRLLDRLPGRRETVRRLESVYFDGDGLPLARAGAILRLRSGDGHVLGFKQGGEREDAPGYFDAVEVETPVPAELRARAMVDAGSITASGLPPAEEVVRRFGRVRLKVVGRLVTERHPVDSRYRVEFDRVDLGAAGSLYELEVETDDPEGARQWLERTFGELGVRAEPQRLTKLQTLLARSGRSPPPTDEA